MNQLLHEMTAQEISEWQAFASIQPFGYRRTDWQIASLAATLANCHRDPKKTKSFQATDFLLFQDEDFEPDSELLARKIQESLGAPPG